MRKQAGSETDPAGQGMPEPVASAQVISVEWIVDLMVTTFSVGGGGSYYRGLGRPKAGPERMPGHQLGEGR